MTNKCEICKNIFICKYKHDYNDTYDQLLKSAPTTNSIFDVDLNCLFFIKDESPSLTSENDRLSDSQIDKFWKDYISYVSINNNTGKVVKHKSKQDLENYLNDSKSHHCYCTCSTNCEKDKDRN